MKTAAATAYLFLTGLLSLPVYGAPTAPSSTELLTRTGSEQDCSLSAALTHSCDINGYYYTCTNGVETLFSCTGGCQVVGNGDVPRCDNGVEVYQAAYKK